MDCNLINDLVLKLNNNRLEIEQVSTTIANNLKDNEKHITVLIFYSINGERSNFSTYLYNWRPLDEFKILDLVNREIENILKVN